ncbi:UNVERIFIED_CONTAM: hypothetical protein FKN15_045403 [Acipenser sinensis]
MQDDDQQMAVYYCWILLVNVLLLHVFRWELPWKRLAADSLREKKMSHMTVGQLTPELVITVKIRST